MPKKSSGVFLILLFIALIFGIIKVNAWIQGQVGDIVDVPPAPTEPAPASEAKPVIKKKTRRLTGEVIRKTRLAPERTFEMHAFYQGGEEIARRKTALDGEVLEQEGEIPDGKVKFIHETDQTYGVEYYQNGKRNGPMRSNFKDGPLEYEAEYYFGNLMTKKDYYFNGVLKSEVDYTDAKDYSSKLEKGLGKKYYTNGQLKYEWRFINSDPTGYRKSYSRNGQLRSAVYFDRGGNEIKPRALSIPQVDDAQGQIADGALDQM